MFNKLKQTVTLSLLALALLAAPAVTSQAVAQSEGPVTPVTIADNIEHPWALAFLPGGDYLVTARGGTLWRIKPGGAKTRVQGLPAIVSQRQGGLLDIVLHPDFENNNRIYFSYVARGEGGTGTEVAHATLLGTRLHNLETIFKAAPKMRSDVHFGSRLLFAPDGTLFVTLGERFHMDEAQKLNSHWGTIVRINDDGSIPADNPFAGRDDALPEIYSYGHRNVQGIALRPGTDEIWAHEHGPQGGDELNILKPGANYGWPEITYGIGYDDSIISRKTEQDGMEQPVIHWTPSIAPSGMTWYDGTVYEGWNGDIFLGALAGAHLRRLAMDGATVRVQEKLLTPMEARIRDVRTGPDGKLYVLTDAADGKLIRLDPR